MKISSSERKLNNKGFSLLELIVTISVMLVLVGIAVATVAVLDSSYVQDAERGIKDYVSMARTKSMSVAAKDWYMSVSKEDSDYYAYLYKVVEKKVEEGGVLVTKEEISLFEKKKLGAKLDIYFGNDTTSMTKVDDDNPLKIYFDPSTGKVKMVTVGSGSMDITSGIGYIKIVRNDYEAVLKVFYNTGKCERE